MPRLPALEDEQEVIHEHRLGSNYRLMAAYDRCIHLYNELNQLHFELLLLAYGAYLTFFQFCQGAFPDMGLQTMSRMIGGYDTTMMRPDDELKALAAKALELGVDGAFVEGRSHEDVLAELEQSDAGRAWIADLESRKHPWFLMSTGDGFYHHHRAWADDLRLPFAAISGYIAQLRDGAELDRPKEQLLAERDRIATEYGELLPRPTRSARSSSRCSVSAATCSRTRRATSSSSSTGARRCSSTRCARSARCWRRTASSRTRTTSSTSTSTRCTRRCRTPGSPGRAARPRAAPSTGRRGSRGARRSSRRLADWSPPPALGAVPEVITDPTVQLLWGVTADRLRAWAGGGADEGVHGYAASPGVVEGVARVVRDVNEIGTVQQGEVLVCPVTAPSWAPVFPKIAAAVSDIGGMMSHAAIIAREYGLPAVVGTGDGTKQIKTGDRVRVDGDNGTVTILD